MDELEDSWSCSYVMREPDAFADMAEQELMNSIGRDGSRDVTRLQAWNRLWL